MKIVHVCLANFFIDNYSYQENMLPKYHKRMGHDVAVVASLVDFDENGKICFRDGAKRYENEYGIPVTRLAYRNQGALSRALRLRRYVGTSEAIEREQPDILFIHGCQFTDMDLVVKYLKDHPNVKVYVDNHADFSNSARNFLSRNVLHRFLWKRSATMIEPYTKNFYGVLPARVEFLKNVYGLPSEKVELLVMGADDEAVSLSAEPEVRKRIRKQYGIEDGDFVIMTGGKIDAFKTQTLLLMQAVKRLNRENVKLIVFGSVIPEMKQQVDVLCDGKKIQYIGWVQAKDTYDLFSAADLVVFPGRHSVFWEQVCGQGIPMLCKKWDGTTHVDVGGNVIFLTEDSEDEIHSAIEDLLDHPETYDRMKKAAMDFGMKHFSYQDIAKRSIETEE